MSRKPWVTSELYKIFNERNNLYDKLIRLKYQVLLSEYKQKRNKLNADLKKAWLKYYKNKFLTVSNHARKMLGVIKSLTGTPHSQIPSILTFDGVNYSEASLVDKFN